MAMNALVAGSFKRQEQDGRRLWCSIGEVPVMR